MIYTYYPTAPASELAVVVKPSAGEISIGTTNCYFGWTLCRRESESEHVEALEALLRSLSGAPKQPFKIHELYLKSGANLGLVPSEVRLVCDLVQSTPTWTVKHIGGAMRGAGAEQLTVLVRSMVESNISKNALRFFYALGYKLDHELLKDGFSVHFPRNRPITVTVTTVYKMIKLHAIDEATPVVSGFQLVEVTAPADAHSYTEVAASVSALCEHLAPLLNLSKPDVAAGTALTAFAAAASIMAGAKGKIKSPSPLQ